MANRAFELLAGYDYISRIGRGAGATINLATEVETERQVAVKHVARESVDDDKFIAQAEVEYEVAHQLEHPGLRSYFKIFRVRKWLKTRHVFLIMEYVPGTRLEDSRPQEYGEIVDVFRQTARGLGAMHDAGFVHADIKPNNLIRGEDGKIKIIDFGQSCTLGTVKDRVQGTPDYIAPEQVLRRAIDQRTDIYNLGATMYWMLTGKYFKTILQNVPMGMKRIELDERSGNASPHELDPEVPLALSNLVLDCCGYDPPQRPQTIRDVLERLDVVDHVLARR